MSDLRDLWQQSFSEADTREIWEWAEQEGELPGGAYAVSGPLDVRTCPMIKGPMRALRKRTVRNVVVMAGVQCLKTLIGELWLLWLVPNDPGPTQWLQPDNDEARQHAKERFLVLMEKFPAVHRYYTASRDDKTQDFIKFAHMFLRVEGVVGDRPPALQRKSIKNQMRSEVWQANKWTLGKLQEADGRLTQFVHNSKTYTESQAGYDASLNVDDMHAAYLAGDQNELTFACLGCGFRQPFVWSIKRADGTRAGVCWDTTERTRRENGDWRMEEVRPTVRYECVSCGHRHYDDPLTRRRITDSLDFVSKNPNASPSTASFTWNQLAMPQLEWFETRIGGVKNFLEAHEQAKKGYDKRLKDFFMKVVCEPLNPAKHSALRDIESIEIASQPEAGTEIEHKGVKYIHRVMTVDVQGDRFCVLVEAWSARGDSLTLTYEKSAPSWGQVIEIQNAYKVPFENVAVDIGHRSQEVKENCTRNGHWIEVNGRKKWVCWKAFRGSDEAKFIWRPQTGPRRGQRIEFPYTPIPETGDPHAGLHINDPRRAEFKGKSCTIYTWSNPTIKDVVFARREGRAKAIVDLVVRGEWNNDYNREIFSQKKVQAQPKYGGPAWKWQKIHDDHALDCKCMSVVIAFQRNLMGASSAEVENESEKQEKV